MLVQGLIACGYFTHKSEGEWGNLDVHQNNE